MTNFLALILSKLALNTKEFENENAEKNRLPVERQEKWLSIDHNLHVFKLTDELLAFKEQMIKRKTSIADAEREHKSGFVAIANQITMLKNPIRWSKTKCRGAWKYLTNSVN